MAFSQTLVMLWLLSLAALTSGAILQGRSLDDEEDFVKICEKDTVSLQMAPKNKYVSRMENSRPTIYVKASEQDELLFKCKANENNVGPLNLTYSIPFAMNNSKVNSGKGYVTRSLSVSNTRKKAVGNTVMKWIKCTQAKTVCTIMLIVIIQEGDSKCSSEGNQVSCPALTLKDQIQSISRSNGILGTFEEWTVVEISMQSTNNSFSLCQSFSVENITEINNITDFTCPERPEVVLSYCPEPTLFKIKWGTPNEQQLALPRFFDQNLDPNVIFDVKCIKKQYNPVTMVAVTATLTVALCVAAFVSAIFIRKKFCKKSKEQDIYRKNVPLSDMTTTTMIDYIDSLNEEQLKVFVDYMGKLDLSSSTEEDGMRILNGEPEKWMPDQPLNSQAHILSYNPGMEVTLEDIQVGKMLGEGNYGYVYDGYVKGLLMPAITTRVAIKTPKDHNKREHLTALVCEMKILCNIGGMHINLVNMLGACTKQLHIGKLHVLLEFCEYGDMLNYIRVNHNDFVGAQALEKSRLLLKWSYHVAKGMEYLAGKKIMHGDLAARNVMLGNDMVAKVGDFGLGKRLYDNLHYTKQERQEVPWKWMALEYLRYNQFYITSDVWSYGVVFWEIFNLGEVPYQGYNDKELKEVLISGERLEYPEILDLHGKVPWFTQEVYDSITGPCFLEDYKKRSSFSDVVKVLENLLSQEELHEYNLKNQDYRRMVQGRTSTVHERTMSPGPGYSTVAVPPPTLTELTGTIDGHGAARETLHTRSNGESSSHSQSMHEQLPASPKRVPIGYQPVPSMKDGTNNGYIPMAHHHPPSANQIPPQSTKTLSSSLDGGYSTLEAALRTDNSTAYVAVGGFTQPLPATESQPFPSVSSSASQGRVIQEPSSHLNNGYSTLESVLKVDNATSNILGDGFTKAMSATKSQPLQSASSSAGQGYVTEEPSSHLDVGYSTLESVLRADDAATSLVTGDGYTKAMPAMKSHTLQSDSPSEIQGNVTTASNIESLISDERNSIQSAPSG